MSRFGGRALVFDWKTMPEGKEKYHAYLASPEWAVRKEAVKARSGGTCEHCRKAPGTQTHHMTYIRKYAEPLSDLLHVCEPCHLFLSGKTKEDPSKARDRFAMIANHRVEKVYLAGKITGTDWRDQIAPGWSYENHSDFPYSDGFENHDEHATAWQVAPACIPVGDHAILDMTGPFWFDPYGGGHGSVFTAPGYHASVPNTHKPFDGWKFVQRRVQAAIEASDLLFAWIDSKDCFGTLVEIGLAARHIPVVIAIPSDTDVIVDLFSQLWLSFEFADFFLDADSPGEAWESFWDDRAACQRRSA